MTRTRVLISLARAYSAGEYARDALELLDRLFADAALVTLERALQLGETEGYVRMFVDEGAPMEALLRKARAYGLAIEYVSNLLAAFDRHNRTESPHAAVHVIDQEYLPLTERELQVLRLLAESASNGEIAQALVISVGTVKKHVNNIFLKLDAHNRTQAVTLARSYKLLWASEAVILTN